MKNAATCLLIGGALLAIIASSAPAAAQDPASPDAPRMSGATLFDDYCKACHGVKGTGDGPLATQLRKAPANLTLLAKKNGGVFSAEMVARIIDGRKPLAGHGGGDMPIWGEALAKSAESGETSAKIAALVAYLESIQQKP